MPESKSRKKPAYVPPPAAKKVSTGNPPWLVPTMVGLMVLGLIWVVITYIFRTEYPIPGIANWNLVIGFVLIIAGFSLTTRWK